MGPASVVYHEPFPEIIAVSFCRGHLSPQDKHVSCAFSVSSTDRSADDFSMVIYFVMRMAPHFAGFLNVFQNLGK